MRHHVLNILDQYVGGGGILGDFGSQFLSCNIYYIAWKFIQKCYTKILEVNITIEQVVSEMKCPTMNDTTVHVCVSH